MKKILLIALCLMMCGVAFSQKTAFQFSFVTPLGTNGLKSAQYTNAVSINLLVGVSENETAFTFGGLANIILNDATGFQFAGLYNRVGGRGVGVQFSGLVNTNKYSFEGVQFAGLVNTAGPMKGVQFGGLSNHAGDSRGIQFAGLVNTARSMKGIQFAGLVNTNKCSFEGVQFAGLVNTAGPMKGVQFGGLSNHAGDSRGIQFAGLVNTAGNMKGIQFAGLTNVVKDVKGVQFAGLVNVAKRVRGVQFAGLVNIAEESDCPIGIVNIVAKGEKSVGVSYEAIGNIMLSFRSGGRYTYGIIGVGYNHQTLSDPVVLEAGWGAHIPCTSWFRINNELKASSIGNFSSEPIFNGGYSLLPAFKLGKHVEIFGGVSVNYMATSDVSNTILFADKSLWDRHTATQLQRLYIGYQFGVQYIF